MVSVPLDQIRPHVIFFLLYAKGERSNFWTLLVKLESEQAFYGRSVVLSAERAGGHREPWSAEVLGGLRPDSEGG